MIITISHWGVCPICYNITLRGGVEGGGVGEIYKWFSKEMMSSNLATFKAAVHVCHILHFSKQSFHWNDIFVPHQVVFIRIEESAFVAFNLIFVVFGLN